MKKIAVIIVGLVFVTNLSYAKLWIPPKPTAEDLKADEQKKEQTANLNKPVTEAASTAQKQAATTAGKTANKAASTKVKY